jgi:hypothetical protein
MPCVHLESFVSAYSVHCFVCFLLPVSPAFGVDHSSICQRHQEFASLIFDVYKVVDQKSDFLADVLALKTMDGHRCLRHGALVS